MIRDQDHARRVPLWVGPAAVYSLSLGMLALNRLLSPHIRSIALALGLEFLVFALPIALMFVYVKGVERVGFWRSLGFASTPWHRTFMFSLVLYFTVFASGWLLFRAAEYISPTLPEAARYDPTAMTETFRDLPALAYWYMILTSIVYAGFGEELIFRGYVLTRLLPNGQILSIALSSLMWSSLHLWYIPVLGSTGLWQHLDVILIGFIFGVAFVRTRNLIPLVLVHSYVNSLLPLSYLYDTDLLNLVAFLVVVAGFVTAIIMLVLRVIRHSARSRVSE